MLHSVQQLKNSMKFYRSAADLGVCPCSWFHPSVTCIACRNGWWLCGSMMPELTTLKHGRTCVVVLHQFLVFYSVRCKHARHHHVLKLFV
ncbi:hypothetical protein GQ55_3G428300 [Panicum hallii var. hallii]|uniref:Uncharacterized protein n=1 Tax=Panicum hallii var. hallii TaxID=1504633 RepID=A0A2T7EHP8_9POAL|nr:hypothetical protein GQ55_3G428300 [Panicum hallii var. hallii]